MSLREQLAYTYTHYPDGRPRDGLRAWRNIMHRETVIPSKDVKAMKARIVAEAKEMVEEYVSEPSKGTSQSDNPLKGLEVEVYAHNATSTGTLTPASVEAILKALGKS